MSSGRILLLAQDTDYRRSLAFLLDAEGYEIIAQGELPLPAASGYDCIVLDHRVLRGVDAPEALSFCRRSGTVILLGARAPSWFDATAGRHVETPIIANQLVAAINDVIADRQLPHS